MYFENNFLKQVIIASLIRLNQIQTRSGAQAAAMSEALSAVSNPQLPTFYCVKEGDSFASIALTECRDANYAASIAAANGYDSPDNTPTTGQVLTIPNLTPSQDDLFTEMPYSVLYNSIVGSLYPQLQTPRPRP